MSGIQAMHGELLQYTKGVGGGNQRNARHVIRAVGRSVGHN